MDDTNELTYPLFHKNMRVVPYDPECFMDCFFSPVFKHNDNIRKWVVLQYKTSGANTLKELQEGKVVFFYSFCKEKALNKQIMKYIDVINQEMNGDFTPNNYNAFCIDKKNGYLFALKEEELFIVNQKNKVYGCFLKDIVMQSQTVRKRNGDIIIGSCDLDPQFVEFSRDIKFLQEDIDLTDTFHPQGIKVAFHTSICGIFYSVLFNLTYRRFYAGVEASVENFVDVFSENVITSVNNGSTMTQISYQDKIARSMVYQSKILERIDEHMTGAFVQQLTETLGKISDMAIDLTKVNQGLESSVSHFDQFTDKMEKYQRMVNASIENMSDQIQVQNDKMQNYIELFGKSLRTSEDMNNKMYQQLEFVDKTLANSKNINEGLSETAEKLNIQLEHIDQISRASQEYFKTSLEAIKESSMKEIQTFSKQTKADIKMVSDTSKKEMEVIKQMSQENIEKIGQAAEQKIEQITVVKRTTSQDIQKVSDSLVDNIEKLTQSMEQKGKAVVDEYYTELNSNIKSFASNIRSMKNATTQMEKIAKEIPVFMLDTKGNIETQFSEMQIKLDQYLEYADKLHSDIANRWELLRTQEEN